ncbi:hypothetical protein M9H77_07331 [Catharanthus roseus]|uniref:Uncharacterized protein n=1 Tax=Catharanthus roseus TaxID=4058 RepID=A0ACC0BUN8_CATRO|nr:hypothetical protein M9H77_07331 [Catharanthus roseus]
MWLVSRTRASSDSVDDSDSGEWIHLKRGVDCGGSGSISLRGHRIMLCGGISSGWSGAQQATEVLGQEFWIKSTRGAYVYTSSPIEKFEGESYPLKFHHLALKKMTYLEQPIAFQAFFTPSDEELEEHLMFQRRPLLESLSGALHEAGVSSESCFECLFLDIFRMISQLWGIPIFIGRWGFRLLSG